MDVAVFKTTKLKFLLHFNVIFFYLFEFNKIAYTIQTYREFKDKTLQYYYNLFVENGQISQSNALQIGATIEDLDIVHLQEYIDHNTNASLISVFESLKCGSKNLSEKFCVCY